jgi:hypothetical protein
MIAPSKTPFLLRARRVHSFGLVMIALLLALSASVVLHGEWGLVFNTYLSAATLILVLRATDAALRRQRVAAGIALSAALLVTLGALGGTPANLRGPASAVAALLVITAPAAIVRYMVRVDRVDAEMIMAAICVYVLLGLLFAFIGGAIETLSSNQYFAQTANPTISDFTYFSYVTLGTLGYGDLSPGDSMARLMAITEMLIGQLYLVTVLALLVANIGRERRRPSSS